MSELAKLYHGFDGRLNTMNKEMKDALGLGKGTLRAQLIQEIDKGTKTVEKRVHTHMTECSASMKLYEEKVHTYDKKLHAWKEMEEANLQRIESLERKLIGWEEGITARMDK